jgi:PBP1b-binding outer membrane lipoprotein LpoB
MKNIYGLFFLLALLLMGCSSTYTIKDFPSKERFYEDFNNSVKNKDVSITLMSDSCL